MSKWLGLAAAAAVVGLGTGCHYGASAFTCTDDNSCGAGGQCEPGLNLCSFPDERCGPAGRSFGDLAGDHSGKCVSGEQPGDGGVDSPGSGIDTPPRKCFGTTLANGLGDVCLDTAPVTDRIIETDTDINTDDPQMCTSVASGGGNFCVVAATMITVNATLRAYGSKPLVLIARDTIAIGATGVIDVASHRGATHEIGAGGDPATCLPGTAPMSANGTNGGGAGGSFAGIGGIGGNGGGTDGGTGGMPTAATSPLGDLRGGCPGQDGQGGGATKGAQGHGGGAVVLIAGGTISVVGKVSAAGEGGGGGASGNAGGGGGGAGGMIVLEAPTITATGLILANGGAGGEGSGSTTAGNPGEDPSGTTAARGGNGGSSHGGDGGDGSAGPVAGPGVLGATGNTGGGGGGGGGAGLTKASATTNLGTQVSPLPTP